MATSTQRTRLRRDVGATATSLPDGDIDSIYTEAAETYATAGAAQDAQARVIAIRGILADSAKLTSYTQNQSREEASDVFKHLKALLALWQDELKSAASLLGNGSMRFGRSRTKPRRIKEYPGI